MNNLMKPIVLVGRLLSIVGGEEFDTPISEILKQYPNLPSLL
jgi:hypothetical protein